jgi:hypothetical protein
VIHIIGIDTPKLGQKAHCGLERVLAMWKARGADVREITLSSGTKAILSNVYDPNGVRMELLQLPPDSLHAQATNRWK